MLFLLFQSTAGDVIPSHLQLSGHLLDNANLTVKMRLMEALWCEYAVLALDKMERRVKRFVNISVGGKVRLRSS